jgi:hypothetical protein
MRPQDVVVLCGGLARLTAVYHLRELDLGEDATRKAGDLLRA